MQSLRTRILLFQCPIWGVIFFFQTSLQWHRTDFWQGFINITLFTHKSFPHQHKLMVFHGSWSYSKSLQVSRTLLRIMAVLNNPVVWMVSSRPLISKSSSPFSNPLVTVPNAPITSGKIVTCMFHSFFNSLARSRYLSFFSHSFSFILWSAGTAKSTILQVLFFFVVVD